MNRIPLILGLILCLSFGLQAQEAKVRKLSKQFEYGEKQAAINELWKIAYKSQKIEHWELLIDMCRNRCDYFDSEPAQLPKQGDSELEKESREMLCNQFINACRHAQLRTQSPRASQLLRNYLVDYYPDTIVTDSSLEFFNLAEQNFQNRDYGNALSHYYNSRKADPKFYQATLYLGDTYYALDVMDSALKYFRIASEMHPNLLEPRKYITDACANLSDYENARKEALETFSIYPDVAMFLKYSDIMVRLNASFDQHWMERKCAVNRINANNAAVKDKLWISYQSAKQDLAVYCDAQGIVSRENNFSEAKYLEVYSWEKMIRANPYVKELSFAKKMMEEGFLDCFVFLSVFHHDLYPQYTHFAINNKERIHYYFEHYLTN